MDINAKLKQIADEMKSRKTAPKNDEMPPVDREAMYRDIAAENHRVLTAMTGIQCSRCAGTGQAVVDGIMRYCPENCDGAVRLRRDNLIKMLNRYGEIPDTYADYTFDTWINSTQLADRDGKNIALFLLQYFVEYGGGEFSLKQVLESDIPARSLPAGKQIAVKSDNDDLTLLIDGKPAFQYFNSVGHSICLASQQKGMGKTGLCVAAAKYLIDSGIGVAFVHLPTLLRDTRTAYENSRRRDRREPPVGHGKTYDELMLPIQQAQVLIVDDCNLPYDASPNDLRVVENDVIIERWSRNLPTIMTTNHTQQSFEGQWGDRAASRVFESYHWATLKGSVIRRRNRPNS